MAPAESGVPFFVKIELSAQVEIDITRQNVCVLHYEVAKKDPIHSVKDLEVNIVFFSFSPSKLSMEKNKAMFCRSLKANLCSLI